MQRACCFVCVIQGSLWSCIYNVPCLFFVSFPVTKKLPFKAYDCLHSATSQITEKKVAVTKPLILHDYSAHNQTNAFQQWQIWPECWTCLGIKLFTIGYLFIWILFFRKCSLNCLSCNRHTSLNGNRKSRRPVNIRAKAQLRPVIKHGPFYTSHKQSQASQTG